MTLLSIAGGLTILVLGAEMLVRGASRLAAALGVSPLIIGLTIVAFGTSSPELAVSLQSALNGQPDLAVGNVVGSNILNVLLILGLSALITPLLVAQQLVRMDVPIMIGASLLLWGLALNGAVSQMEGAALFVLMLAYIGFLLWQSRREHNAAVEAEYAQEYTSPEPKSIRTHLINSALVIIGLGLLVLGSRLFVQGASDLARAFGLSELVIGLTIVALGTSLPEVAASLMAAFKGERDIAVGNVVGSNIFNLLTVLALTALIAPGGVPVSAGALNLDIPFMVAVAIACLPIFLTGHTIARWEGAIFFGYYVAYTLYLLLDAANHPNATQYFNFMLFFVAPLTVLTLMVSLGREASRRRAGAPTTAPEK
ncbi:MAG TPA: calcium/sodium antiporter [Chloroflexi bacterium]|nr:calcium/sodium antiporter [Chloroflexota bacterium]